MPSAPTDSPGEDILVADGEAEFAAAVLRVLEDGETAARLAAAGRRYAEEQFDWRVVCRKLDEVYAGVGR
jgi:glycosyltransferase involved in cell wall biosynthesis